MINIFDIQHFCVHDGPGIRTTVFLKGCPLHCRWCHNPESLRPEKQMMFFADKCVNCGMCVRACKKGAHVFSRGRHIYIREKCNLCGECVTACSQRALEVSGYEMDEKGLFQRILRDKAFYGPDGGVTFSGGEPLLQFEKLRGVLKCCREEGIHTAVETSLLAPEKVIRELHKEVDLIICDFKIADPSVHKEYTGVSNERILSNMKYLLERRAEQMWVRTPVIPGINDNPRNMEAMACFLAPYPVARVELLPFHDIGLSKYTALGQSYEFADENFISEEKMESLRKILGL